MALIPSAEEARIRGMMNAVSPIKSPLTVANPALTEAATLVNGERQEQYGDPKVNCDRVARMWEIILEHPVTPGQVTLCMTALKMARELHKHDDDNVRDAIGYLLLYDIVK